MVRMVVLLAAALAVGGASAALAQEAPAQAGPGGQQPRTESLSIEIPGPATEIVGPNGAFRLKPDGVTWQRFQSARAVGVRCSKASCGGDRVFCLIQPRASKDARAGEPTSQANAEELGAGVIRNAPKELPTSYAAPFVEKTFGGNHGRWAEMTAEGGADSLRLALFLTKAEKYFVAFNCVTPKAKWDENRPKFESLLANLRITK